MRESLVKIDNQMVWDGKRRPFFELYSLATHDTKGAWALWWRYALQTPAPGHPRGLAGVWAIFAERGGKRLLFRQDFDMGAHDVMHAEQFIQVGGNALSLAGSSGALKRDRQILKWDLHFEDPVESFRPLRYPWLYDLPVPALKVTTPRLAGFVTGTVFVEHRKLELLRAKIHQNHAFGGSPGGDWAFAHCIDFREDADAYFEATSGAVPLGSGRAKKFHSFCFGIEGRRYAANSAVQMLWRNRSDCRFETWRCEFEKERRRFTVLVRRHAENALGLSFAGPAPEGFYGYPSPFCDVHVRVEKRERGLWRDDRELTSDRGVFETLSAVPEAAVPVAE